MNKNLLPLFCNNYPRDTNIDCEYQIIIRERAQKHLESLQTLVDNWRRGHHRPITPATGNTSIILHLYFHIGW